MGVGEAGFEGRFPGGTFFQFSSTGGPGGGPFRPSRPEDIFAQFFGGSSFGGGQGVFDEEDEGPFAAFGRGGMDRGGHVLRRQFPLTLEELYSGCTKKLKVTKRLIDRYTRKAVPTEKILTITVKPGWKSGTKIKFPGEGDELPDGRSQDIEFVVEEKAHPVYKRNGDDLHMTMNLSLLEALCGFSKTIRTLDGKELMVSNKAVTVAGQEIKFPGRGMPNQRAPLTRGSLVITIQVTFPPSLTDAQKDLIRSALQQ